MTTGAATEEKMCRRGVGVLYGQQRRRSVIMGNGRKCGRAGGGRREELGVSVRGAKRGWAGGSWLLGGGLWGACTEKALGEA